MIDQKEFKHRLQTFEQLDYAGDFKGFWKWKLRTELKNAHILDDAHRRETYHRLSLILPGWLTYRPFDSAACLKILKDSLRNMSEAYNQVRSYTLLEFDEIPDEPLELIWHELGRAKEVGGNKNSTGYYYIVSICKPLMFLWGQTLAFDSLVRENVPLRYNVPKSNRWSFENWERVMKKIQRNLKQNSEATDFFKQASREKYETDSIVPYGQFLDLYYWIEGKEKTTHGYGVPMDHGRHNDNNGVSIFVNIRASNCRV